MFSLSRLLESINISECDYKTWNSQLS